MAEPTHDCPCGCGKQITQDRVACKPGWYLLPKDIRDEVWRTYRARQRDPSAHRRALHEAMQWYRDNPRVR